MLLLFVAAGGGSVDVSGHFERVIQLHFGARRGCYGLCNSE